LCLDRSFDLDTRTTSCPGYPTYVHDKLKISDAATPLGSAKKSDESGGVASWLNTG
jgi:hypothetical protein